MSTKDIQQYVLESGERVLNSLKDGKCIPLRDVNDIAFALSRGCFTDIERNNIRGIIWTDEFITLSCHYILQYQPNWSTLLIAIGNMTASSSIKQIPIYRNSSFLNMIQTFLKEFNEAEAALLSPEEAENTPSSNAAWIVANIVQSSDGDIPTELLTFTPVLLHLLATIPTIPIPIEENKIGDILIKYQLHLRCFRALSGIFSLPFTQTNQLQEFYAFRSFINNHPFFIYAVLYEYQLGLNSKSLPNLDVYPDAYHRSLTILYLTRIPGCQHLLLQQNVIPLLTNSLHTVYRESNQQTSYLWKRSIRSLYHLLISSRESRLLMRRDENIESVLWTASWEEEKLRLKILNFEDRRIAAEIASFLRFPEFWEIERLLWITQRKKQPINCYIKHLPEELIPMILKWIILFQSTSEKYTKMRFISNGYS